MTRNEHRIQMKRRITDFQESGQNLTTWCRDHEISYYQMQYWQKKFRAEKTSDTHSSYNCTALEVHEGRQPRASISIKVRPATVEVEAGFDPSHLANVIRTLKSY